MVNEDHPQYNVPRKAIKACSDRGQVSGPLPLSLTQRVAMSSLFLHRTSVVRVNLFIAATTHGPCGLGSASQVPSIGPLPQCSYGGPVTIHQPDPKPALGGKEIRPLVRTCQHLSLLLSLLKLFSEDGWYMLHCLSYFRPQFI